METHDPFAESFKGIAAVIRPIQHIQEIITGATRAFTQSVLPTLAAIAEALDRLPAELRPVVNALAERGWFISAEMDMSHFRAFMDATDAGDYARLDTMMQEWIRDQLPRIKASACDRFPNRAEIISSAMDAHEAGQFALSVPVLLIQVEGMCVEVFGTKLYSTEGGMPRTRAATETLLDGPLSEILFLPLREPTALTASKALRSNYPDAPNRHEIVHGIDTHYATAQTSEKVISLLDYFTTFVVPDVDKNNPSSKSGAS
jgi:hypothetical protein